MSISMIGVDHTKAGADIRASFSFTKKQAQESMKRLKSRTGILGALLLSTCNRTELWISHSEEWTGSLFHFLCGEKNMDRENALPYFTERRGKEAVRHLFFLAAGLKSQILAEDQIITQVKEALALAREAECTDGVLEVLFRTAVTGAKKVKTQVTFSRGNRSVIHQAMEQMKAGGYSFAGKTCMVIGNGEMGRVAATALREEGAKVTVTVRQYRSGVVMIPEGCSRIHYGERMQLLPRCDLVVSATASPNVTLTKAQIEEAHGTKALTVIDLAVPRDVEPQVKELPFVTLYHMDDFQITALTSEMRDSLEKAQKLLEEEMETFENWYQGRDLIPKIEKIREKAAQDMLLRLEKRLNGAAVEPKEREAIKQAVVQSGGNVAAKLIFALRDFLEPQEFRHCMEGLEKLYEE